MTAAEIHSRVSARETAEVMGLRLVPLTLGHARLMDHLGCDGLADASEVALAVLICSRPQHRVLRFLRSPLMPLRLLIWKWYLGAWDVESARNALLAYLRRHTELPHIIRPESAGGAPCPVPHHQMLRVLLLSRLGYKPSEVDAAPHLQAVWDAMALEVREGRAGMLDMTSEDMERMESEVDWGALERQASEILTCSN